MSGQPAPDFTLPSTNNTEVTLSSFKGKQAVVLYFYPRDNTQGCPAEACSFRDLRTLFNENGAEILGVSPDTIKSHKKFQQKYRLHLPAAGRHRPRRGRQVRRLAAEVHGP